jgi:CRISPR-associated protein Csa1
MWRMRAFELRRVVERAIDAIARHGRCGGEALAADALPISVQVPVDGRYIGIGKGLIADAICWTDGIALCLAWGPVADHHRLKGTAIALALESTTGRPMDIAGIVYVQVVDGWVQVKRDYHLVGDEERQLFIEQRDELMRVLDSEMDPGLALECSATCAYYGDCYPRQEEGVSAQDRVVFANLPTPSRTWAARGG